MGALLNLPHASTATSALELGNGKWNNGPQTKTEKPCPNHLPCRPSCLPKGAPAARGLLALQEEALKHRQAGPRDLGREAGF